MEESDALVMVYYFASSLVLMGLYHTTKTLGGFAVVHRVLSLVNLLVLAVLFGRMFWKFSPYLVILVPILLGFMAALGYGLNEELSDSEKVHFVSIRPYDFGEPSPFRMALASLVLEFLTFPGLYTVKAWKKNQE